MLHMGARAVECTVVEVAVREGQDGRLLFHHNANPESRAETRGFNGRFNRLQLLTWDDSLSNRISIRPGRINLDMPGEWKEWRVDPLTCPGYNPRRFIVPSRVDGPSHAVYCVYLERLNLSYTFQKVWR